ncbi:Glutathione synthetase [Trachipleistophora hominis]|uniref:Glutathione synthetase n=1 Tax=Trachipleistophora hominis TaxID=72359 RepID=L7JUM0_TRAHO|nr:Glutathione synthetase [Trachipleistophora hominis]
MSDHFKDLLYANALINTTNNFVPINVTRHPSKFPADKVVEALKLQKVMNILLYKAIKDHATYEISTMDEIYNMLVKMKRTNNKKKLTLIYMRTDYLLNKDYVLKQVEINTISVAFVELNPRLNKVHSVEHKNVWLPENMPKFVQMVTLVRDSFIETNGYNDVIALLLDDNTSLQSANFFEKKNLIFELAAKGITMLHVTAKDIEIKGVFENDKFIYDGKCVFFVYLRYFYNYDHHDDNIMELRRRIENSDAVTLPSIELQIIGLKMFQVIFESKDVLRKYLSDAQVKSIYDHFGDFKNIKDYQTGDENTYILKSMREGGNTIITEDFQNYINEPDKYFLMKKIDSITVSNRFYTEKDDVDMILELGVLGTLIEYDGNVILNEPSGFICRSKKKGSNECGVTCNYGGLDSVYKN